MADLLRVSSGDDSRNLADENTPLTADVPLETDGGVDVDVDVDDESREKNFRLSKIETEEFSPSSSSSSSSRIRNYPLLLRSASSSVLSTFSDDSGSIESLRCGLLIVGMGGTILGIAMPKNDDLLSSTTRFGLYPTLSSILGYTYFLSWSISFYVFLKKSVDL